MMKHPREPLPPEGPRGGSSYWNPQRIAVTIKDGHQKKKNPFLMIDDSRRMQPNCPHSTEREPGQ